MKLRYTLPLLMLGLLNTPAYAIKTCYCDANPMDNLAPTSLGCVSDDGLAACQQMCTQMSGAQAAASLLDDSNCALATIACNSKTPPSDEAVPPALKSVAPAEKDGQYREAFVCKKVAPNAIIKHSSCFAVDEHGRKGYCNYGVNCDELGFFYFAKFSFSPTTGYCIHFFSGHTRDHRHVAFKVW
jgi:hypothetical protein